MSDGYVAGSVTYLDGACGKGGRAVYCQLVWDEPGNPDVWLIELDHGFFCDKCGVEWHDLETKEDAEAIWKETMEFCVSPPESDPLF